VRTDKSEWRDIRVLYDVDTIVSIVIGDKNYVTDPHSFKLTDQEILTGIQEQKKFPDNVAERLANKIKKLGRLSSNRNDFFIRIEKNDEAKTVHLYTERVPFENIDKSL